MMMWQVSPVAWGPNALGGYNLTSERRLVLVRVGGNSFLVVVRLGLKEILGAELGAEGRLRSRGEGGSRGQDGC